MRYKDRHVTSEERGTGLLDLPQSLITAGVPQGSVLGHHSFMIKPVGDSVNKYTINLQGSADTQISVT